jgi:hypothetical protein
VKIMPDSDSPDEALECYYYNPRWSTLDAEGDLTVKYSGYDSETTHYTGHRTFGPTAPDYPFWVWLTQQKRPEGIVTKEELARYRAEFEAVAEQGPA